MTRTNALLELRRHALELAAVSHDIAQEAGVAARIKAGDRDAALAGLADQIAQVADLRQRLIADAKQAGLL